MEVLIIVLKILWRISLADVTGPLPTCGGHNLDTTVLVTAEGATGKAAHFDLSISSVPTNYSRTGSNETQERHYHEETNQSCQIVHFAFL